ncbi:MAG: NADH-quinone oxidoreductase subunit C [Actinomycetes bacterium]
MTTPIVVPVDQWRERVRHGIAGGARFSALYGADDGDVRCVLTSADGTATVLRSPAGGGIDSIVDLIPAAGWAEREAHDLYRFDFGGHEPLRPLVRHAGDWRVPVSGEGVHEIAVGPIHAGIIESGHFRIHAVGELMLLIDMRMFYKYRGLQRAAQGRTLAEGSAYVQRACAGCAVANTLAYTLAIEQILGVEPAAEQIRVRTILLELERLWNHLNDLSAMCAGIGFAVGTMAFAGLKERAQRLNHRLFGHRFLFDTVSGRPGAISPTMATDLRDTVTLLAADLQVAWRVVLFNASVQERLRGTGILDREVAASGGAVGPVARASGVQGDVRTTSAMLAYQGFEPVVLEQAVGDVAARAQVRYQELLATLDLLERLVDPTFSWTGGRPVEHYTESGDGVAVGRVESARGETVCCVESTGGVIDRVHLRTSSYANWPLVGAAAAGNLVGEFPIINKSFELCYACVDR